jgi:hypothetical protein
MYTASQNKEGIQKPDKFGIRMVNFKKNRATAFQTIQKPDKFVQFRMVR